MMKNLPVKIKMYDQAGDLFMVVAKTEDSWKLSRHTGEAGYFPVSVADKIIHTIRSAYPTVKIEKTM